MLPVRLREGFPRDNLEQQHQLQPIPAQQQLFNNLKQQHQLQPIPAQQQLFNNLQK